MYPILICSIAVWLAAAAYSVALPARAQDRRLALLVLTVVLTALGYTVALLSAKGPLSLLAAFPIAGPFSLLVGSVALLAVFSLDRMLLEQRETHEALVAASEALGRENAERKRAEAALGESEQRLRAILDNTTAIIYVKDLSGRYMLVNKRYEEMVRRTSAEIEGKTDHDLFPREIADAYRANDLKVLESDAPMEFDEAPRRGGKPCHLISMKVPLRDSSGAVYAVCGISADVTERVRAQQDRDRIFELSPDMMFTGSFDGYLGLCNPACEDILGYRVDELARMHFSELLHPDDLERALADFDKVKSGTTLEESPESRWRCKDGSYKWLSWKVVPVLPEQRIYAVARDVTAKRLAEETMRQHRERIAHVLRVHTMGELAAQVAHELNQPLTAIASYANGAVRRLEGNEARQNEIASALRKIAEQALEAGRLIHQITGFAKRGGLRLERVNVNALVEGAVGLLKAGTDLRVEVRLELDPSVPEVEADPVQIEQVLVNLMRNGIEAMETGGDGSRLLQVATSLRDPDQIWFWVQDRGVGLPYGRVADIFEPFYTTKPSGLGMGLTISRTIMEAHGGCLWASRNPDGGVTLQGMMPVRQPSS